VPKDHGTPPGGSDESSAESFGTPPVGSEPQGGSFPDPSARAFGRRAEALAKGKPQDGTPPGGSEPQDGAGELKKKK